MLPFDYHTLLLYFYFLYIISFKPESCRNFFVPDSDGVAPVGIWYPDKWIHERESTKKSQILF